MMDDYFLILGIGVAIGFIDFAIKEIPKWDDLKPIFQGTSWHMIIAALYILVITGLSTAHFRPVLYFGLFAIINEDFAYWIFRYIYVKLKYRNKAYTAGWKLRPPFNLPVWLYYSYLLLINGSLIYLFERY